ncbi:hypothetical protein [Henriciella aquimarina]|uniref:hypothetical protein n=1 Tax=Henriciella aquimarina TaxID=545261 RepID=UPI000A045B7A|nr:hypothetical protein [Henriciella aquimarina]
MFARLGGAALIFVSVVGMQAQAQQDAAERAGPCKAAPYHAFDFWIGDWRVTDPAGEFAGTNTVTREEEGCLLVEHWTSARGTTGQSYNYYDPGKGVWRQIWVSPSAVIDYEGGPNQVGDMILKGTIKYRNGRSHPFRGTWTENEDGSVTQHFEEYDPEGERWEDWFIGTYRRK